MSDHLAERLVASLDRHAAAAPGGTDLAPRALRLARRMRIRRRIGAAAVAVVLVGGAIPLGAGLSGRLDTPQAGPPPVTKTSTHPSATATTTATPSWRPSPTGPSPTGPATPVVIDVERMPAGGPPGAPWVAGGVIHSDGRQIALDPAIHPSAVTAVGGGFVVVDQPAGGKGPRLLRIDRTGRSKVLSAGPVNPAVAASRAAGELAWTRPVGGGTQLVLARSSDGTVLDTLKYPGDLTPVGFVGGMVILSQQGSEPSAQVWIPGRGITPIPGALGATATDAAAGLAAVTTRYGQDPRTGAGRTCSAVIDVADDNGTIWKSCRYRPVSFSPDSRFAFAVDSTTEGLGASRAYVLDAKSGRALVRLRIENTTQRVAWESGDTVVIDAWTGGRMALVRCTTGGRCERATDAATSADPTDPTLPYLLGDRP